MAAGTPHSPVYVQHVQINTRPQYMDRLSLSPMTRYSPNRLLRSWYKSASRTPGTNVTPAHAKKPYLWRSLATALGVTLGLSGCSLLPSVGYRNPADLHTPPVVLRPLPLSPYGNSPYTVNGRTYYPLHSALGYKARGIASWYGRPFNGQKTSDGSTYNMYAMTAANKVLPLPSYALVRNLNNGRSVIVLVNDRGPFYPHRIIDLSYAAAAKLGVIASGTAPVEVEGIVPGETSVFGQPLTVNTQNDRPMLKPVFGPSHDVFGPRPTAPQAPVVTPNAESLQSANNVFGSSSRPHEAPPSGFFIQFGAFDTAHDAAHLRDHLHQAGLKSLHVFQKTIHNQRLYLVQAGPEGSRRRAQQRAARIDYEGLGPTLVVRD